MDNEIFWIILGSVGVLGIVYLLLFAIFHNAEVALRNLIRAQRNENRSTFDNFTKEIVQLANVTGEYRKTVREILVDSLGVRYQSGMGRFAAFIQENNPAEYDASILKDLMNRISAFRLTWNREQKKLIDLVREHRNLRQQFPSSLFVGNRPDEPDDPIQSDDTNDVFNTGRDNDPQKPFP